MNTPIIADFEPCVDWPDGDRQDRGQSVICEGPCQRGPGFLIYDATRTQLVLGGDNDSLINVAGRLYVHACKY